MFGFSWSEILIIAVVALLVVGPKDLPRAMKRASRWMSAGQKLRREFQGHVDDLVREAELEELRDQAKALSGQSLSAHLESMLDPDHEIAKTFSPENLLPALEPAPVSAAASVAEAETAEEEKTIHPPMPGQVRHGS